VASVVSEDDQDTEDETLTEDPPQVALAVRDTVDPTATEALVGLIESAVTVPLAQELLLPLPLRLFEFAAPPPHPHTAESARRIENNLKPKGFRDNGPKVYSFPQRDTAANKSECSNDWNR
jgi:hypothetical protein